MTIEAVLNNQQQFHVTVGDVLEKLAEMPAECVHLAVTSPPYWNLRSYQAGSKEIGQEETPEAYVTKMVAVGEAIKRVLRPEGTFWINIGDTVDGNVLGIPWRVVLALQASGWILRDSMVWLKLAPLPSSVMGWRWEKHKIKAEKSVRAQTGYNCLAYGKSPQGANTGGHISGAAKWLPCPGCSKCEKTDGYILRKGSWRTTTAHEMVFMFSKAPWIGPSQGRFAKITDEDARWLALLFDTEGNICIRRDAKPDCINPQHSLQLAVGNTNKELLEKAKAIAGGVGNLNIGDRGVNAPCWYWTVASKQAMELLYRIYPYFIVKKRQARCAIYLESLRSSAQRGQVGRFEKRGRGYKLTQQEVELRDRIWTSVKSLNHFGNPDISWVPEPVYGHWGESQYYADGFAQRQKLAQSTIIRDRYTRVLDSPDEQYAVKHNHETISKEEEGANLRSFFVFGNANPGMEHYAAYPLDLPLLAIQCGTSPQVCSSCGLPYARIRDSLQQWRASCTCNVPPTNAICLDPFSGSGTTLLAALKLGRRGIGIELNPEYAQASIDRLQKRGQAKKKKKMNENRVRLI